MLILWYVAHKEYGANYDLLVWAETPDEAIGYWHSYYDGDNNDLPPLPDLIFAVPTRSPKRGALSWHESVPEVRAPIATAKAAFNLGKGNHGTSA